MVKNAYIHIPFCRSKCNYCSFVSYEEIGLKNHYIKALESEISSFYNGELLETLYFGGGTPTLLEITDFKRVLNTLNYDKNTEITVEMNPEKIEKNYLNELKKIGINRLSIGAQVFDDKSLETIGRRHKSKDVEETLEIAQGIGFNNISVDLIYGLPNQTIEAFKESLNRAINLNIQHISLYGLKIDEGCKFFDKPPDSLPDGDTQAEMYLSAIDTLQKSGFFHYEISNFAKKGFESKHNLNYWENKTYYGFGVAASGYEGCVRYSNQTALNNYINNPLTKLSTTKLSLNNVLEEEIFLGFRILKGINVEKINSKFGINFDVKYKNIIDKYISSKHLSKTKEGYSLTTEGILLSNIVLSDFID